MGSADLPKAPLCSIDGTFGGPLVNPYLRAATRFWWVLTLGLLLACVVAVSVVYRVDLGFPPSSVKAIPILARTASLLAHLAEERERPIGFELARAAEEAVEYRDA